MALLFEQQQQKKLKRIKRPIILLEFQFYFFFIIQIPYKSFDISSVLTVTVLFMQVALN